MALSGEVRAARTAGKKPPTRPIPQAQASDQAMIGAVGWKENTTSDQLEKLTIEKCTNPMARDAAAPTIPPATARATASRRNDIRMLDREKPSARSVPISFSRLAT